MLKCLALPLSFRLSLIEARLTIALLLDKTDAKFYASRIRRPL